MLKVGLADGQRLRIDLLAEEINVGVRIKMEDSLLGQGRHPARSAAGIVDGANDVVVAQRLGILGKQHVHHEANDFARRKVLARIIFQSLLETAYQFLEDLAHLLVANRLRDESIVDRALTAIDTSPIRVYPLACFIGPGETSCECPFVVQLLPSWPE